MERRAVFGTLAGAVLAGGIAAVIGATALSGGSMIYFNWLMYGGAAGAFLGLSGLLALLVWPSAAPPSDVSTIGDDNTFVNVKPLFKAGSGNTIVGSTTGTDSILNKGGVSIGANAGHDPTSIIIGSGAGANIGKKKDE